MEFLNSRISEWLPRHNDQLEFISGYLNSRGAFRGDQFAANVRIIWEFFADVYKKNPDIRDADRTPFHRNYKFLKAFTVIITTAHRIFKSKVENKSVLLQMCKLNLDFGTVVKKISDPELDEQKKANVMFRLLEYRNATFLESVSMRTRPLQTVVRDSSLIAHRMIRIKIMRAFDDLSIDWNHLKHRIVYDDDVTKLATLIVEKADIPFALPEVIRLIVDLKTNYEYSEDYALLSV